MNEAQVNEIRMRRKFAGVFNQIQIRMQSYVCFEIFNIKLFFV